MKKYAGYLISATVCLVLAAFFRFALMGYGFLGLCLAALAALILCFMGLKILSKRHEKAALSLKKVLIYLIIIGLLAASVTEAVVISECVAAGAGESGERYAIVLGAGVNGAVPSRALRARLEAALAFARENPDAALILSGGQGPGEDISEAQCMFNWLTQHGVTPERLILEDKSTSTEENLSFSREKLREHGAENEPVAIITAGYHIARARLMAGDLGYQTVTARAAFTGYPILELNYFLREIPAIWVYLLTR